MKKLLAAALVLLSVSSASAATTNGGYPACVTEDMFDQFIQAMNRKDEDGLYYLMTHGCTIPDKGLKISVLDTTFSGKAKIRIYVGNDAIVMWTNIENVNY